MGFRLPQPPCTPPPPTDMERIADAIEILNSIDCEYEIRIRQTTFTRKSEPTTEEEKADPSEQLPPLEKALLSQKVEELDLSVRTRNLLKANGINTLLDLCRLKKTDYLKFRNGGKKSFIELDDFLTDHNLTWGMDV